MKKKEEIFDIIDTHINENTLYKIQNNHVTDDLSISLVKIIDDLFGEKTNYIKYKRILPRKAFVRTNKIFSNGYIENVSYGFFINFYPRIMIANKSEWADKLDYPELFDVLEICMNNKHNYKGTSLYNKIKLFCNCLYGYLTSEKSDTINITKDYISYTGYNIMNDIMDKFKNNIISIDTDEIYIKNYKDISQEFDAYILNIGLPFEMDFTDKNGIFFNNPKYKIIFDKNKQIIEQYSRYPIK